MSGHVSSRSGPQLLGVSQQSGNVVPNSVAAGGGAPPAAFGADTDLLRARSYMQEKIFVLLAQRHQQPINDSQMQKLKDIVVRLEDGLFKSSHSKADISGHLSCQSGTQLPGVSQQNGNVVLNIVAAGTGALHAAFSMDTDLLRARSYIQEKIFVLLAQRHAQPINDSQMQKLKDIVIRLEDGLFKSSHSKAEYMNLGTLESRLRSLIKRPSIHNRNPVNPNSMTTMVPTPGLSHNGSSTMMATSSVDAPLNFGVIVRRQEVGPTKEDAGDAFFTGSIPISLHISVVSEREEAAAIDLALLLLRVLREDDAPLLGSIIQGGFCIWGDEEEEEDLPGISRAARVTPPLRA
ncbi:hypothetical protein NL676_009979 [Syzygium grande]|nr:hypothetical protein NL676_009979 [Syzygium grande]